MYGGSIPVATAERPISSCICCYVHFIRSRVPRSRVPIILAMDTTPLSLTELGQHRDNVLTRLTSNLAGLSAVRAAWLCGSFGRGEQDEWSDLDLHVALTDESFAGFSENPRPLFELAGDPLLVQAGFPSDSMPGGQFWLVVYRGPVEVDWNIGPVSLACRPLHSMLLFEQQPIPMADSPSPPGAESIASDSQRAIEFFWAMAPIALKYAGRGHTRLAVRQVDLLASAYSRLWRAINNPGALAADAYHQNRPMENQLAVGIPRFATHISAMDTVDVIERFCQLVEAMHEHLAELGVGPPTLIPEEVRRLTSIARTRASLGGSSLDRGTRR